MSTSDVILWEPTTTQFVEWGFSILGVAQEGEALTPRMYQDGLRSLNGLIQSLSAYPHLFTATEGTVTPVASQAAYVVSPRALRVLECRYRLSGIDTPMTMFSRQEYFDQPNKTVSPSIPVNFYFDPQVSNGTLYLWPAPSAAFVASYSIHFTYLRFIDIQTASNQSLDIPQQWAEVIAYNLAKRLASQYPVNDPNLLRLILSQADETLARLAAWDNEPASLFMQVENRWGQ